MTHKDFWFCRLYLSQLENWFSDPDRKETGLDVNLRPKKSSLFAWWFWCTLIRDLSSSKERGTRYGLSWACCMVYLESHGPSWQCLGTSTNNRYCFFRNRGDLKGWLAGLGPESMLQRDTSACSDLYCLYTYNQCYKSQRTVTHILFNFSAENLRDPTAECWNSSPFFGLQLYGMKGSKK